MCKFNAWIASLYFVPELPNPKFPLPNHNVVEENHPPRGELANPLFKVGLYRIVGVVTIYVKKVDRAVVEVREGIFEVHPKERRKSAELSLVIRR